MRMGAGTAWAARPRLPKRGLRVESASARATARSCGGRGGLSAPSSALGWVQHGQQLHRAGAVAKFWPVLTSVRGPAAYGKIEWRHARSAGRASGKTGKAEGRHSLARSSLQQSRAAPTQAMTRQLWRSVRRCHNAAHVCKFLMNWLWAGATRGRGALHGAMALSLLSRCSMLGIALGVAALIIVRQCDERLSEGSARPHAQRGLAYRVFLPPTASAMRDVGATMRAGQNRSPR